MSPSAIGQSGTFMEKYHMWIIKDSEESAERSQREYARQGYITEGFQRGPGPYDWRFYVRFQDGITVNKSDSAVGSDSQRKDR